MKITKVKPYYVCESCGITSKTKRRLIPCARGLNCDAQIKGKIITTKEVILYQP